MNDGWGNGIGIQFCDCSQEASDLIRQLMIVPPLLNHDCDTIPPRSCQGYTDWVSVQSETPSDLLGLITDFIRQLYLFLLFHGESGIDLGLSPDLLGQKPSRPGINSPRKSETT